MKTKTYPTSVRIFITASLMVLAFLLTASPVAAQDEYRIGMRRDFGFSSGSQMRGDFTISLSGPEEQVASVTFLIDGQEMITVSEAPFRYRFDTDDYPLGVHDLSARVTLQDGTILDVPSRRFEFVSGEVESSTMVKILVPLLGITLLAAALGGGVQMLAKKKGVGGIEPGTQRDYGAWGGSICPKCNRPTRLHFGGLNLLTGKLSRCENCGKWSVMRRYPIHELRAAEQAELELEKASINKVEKSEEEKLREMLDKSKYMN